MQIREFNRNHRRRVGAMDLHYQDTDFSVQEARLLWEINNEPGLRAADIQTRTGMGQAHVSRIIKRLAPLVVKSPHPQDGRAQSLRLTTEGFEQFTILDERSETQAAAWPTGATAERAMSLLDSLWDGSRANIRQGTMGDLGIAFGEQCRIYHEQHGYSPVFEQYFCESLPSYLANYDPNLDRLWVAEIGQTPVGWIAIQHGEPGVANMHWFLVKPEAQRQGLGQTLLQMAINFSSGANYQRIELRTVDDLHAARRLYERAGFILTEESATCPWKDGAHEQTWRFDL